jgi:hypothetical protein
MRAASITWASGRGLVPGNREFLGPVKWHRADRRVPFGAKKNSAMQKLNSFVEKLTPYNQILRYFRGTV